jgi:hypothetical protein
MVQTNSAYCKAVAAELHHRKDPFGIRNRKDDEKKVWERYFSAQFPKDGAAKLFLVLDGVDEAYEGDQTKLVDLLLQISKDELKIQVVLTGRPHVAPIIKALAPVSIIEITKTKIAQ